MPDDYQFWPHHDADYPLPVDEINVHAGNESLASASCTARFPAEIPFPRTMMEQSAGISHSWRFTVALMAHRQGGKVNSHLICTATHVHWFEEHGETGSGGTLVFRINPGIVIQNRSKTMTQDMGHGPHFDRVTVTYLGLDTGDVLIQFIGIHQTWGRIGEPDQPRIAPPGSSTQPVTPGGVTPGGTTSPKYEDEPPPQASTKRVKKMPSKPKRGRKA